MLQKLKLNDHEGIELDYTLKGRIISIHIEHNCKHTKCAMKVLGREVSAIKFTNFYQNFIDNPA